MQLVATCIKMCVANTPAFLCSPCKQLSDGSGEVQLEKKHELTRQTVGAHARYFWGAGTPFPHFLRTWRRPLGGVITFFLPWVTEQCLWDLLCVPKGGVGSESLSAFSPGQHFSVPQTEGHLAACPVLLQPAKALSCRLPPLPDVG